MIYRVKPSLLKAIAEHAVAYGIVMSVTYEEPYFKVETDKPFPADELDAIGFEVWE